MTIHQHCIYRQQDEHMNILITASIAPLLVSSVLKLLPVEFQRTESPKHEFP